MRVPVLTDLNPFLFLAAGNDSKEYANNGYRVIPLLSFWFTSNTQPKELDIHVAPRLFSHPGSNLDCFGYKCVEVLS